MNAEVANAVGISGEKRYASTMRCVLEPTDARLHRNTESRSVYCLTAGLMNRTRNVRLAAKRVRRMKMSKAVLISIRPEWCDLILQGKKTVEVRKTRPKMKTPFKVYNYCTKAPRAGWLRIVPGKGWLRLDGLVIGEFTCDRISTITPPGPFSIRNGVSGCCLTYDEVKEYAGWNNIAVPHDRLRDLYGWHISDLKIYDKPRDLDEFSRFGFFGMGRSNCVCGNWRCENYEPSENHMIPPTCKIDGCSICRPPQSWCYVTERMDE